MIETIQYVPRKISAFPKHLDEKVSALHLAKIGVELETRSTDQAECIGVTVECLFKSEHYRH